jgi:endonuclease/exonuclease/phosphatase family metal-dependent hydrolase
MNLLPLLPEIKENSESMKTFFLFLFCLFTVFSSAQTDTLRIATFNIRYDNKDDYPNDWVHRRDTLAAFVRAQGLDLIGMQEVLHNQLEDLAARLPQYEHIGVGRDDGRQRGEYAPLFFRKDRFRLLESGTFWLSQYPDSAGFIGWDGACTRLATWALLRDLQKGEELFVLNTHFDHVGTEARRQSARLVRRMADSLAQGRKLILTGDLNVSDQSDAYRLLLADNASLKDAWKTAEKRSGATYTFHDFGRLPVDSRAKIDFVFVDTGFRVLNSFIPAEDGRHGFLSDHNPQLVVLCY